MVVASTKDEALLGGLWRSLLLWRGLSQLTRRKEEEDAYEYYFL